MKKTAIFIGILIVLIVIATFIFNSKIKKEDKSSKITMPENILEGKKVAMIMAFKNFRDAEYFVTKETLEKFGVVVTSVSTKKGIALGADGGEVEVDLTLEELKLADFNGIIFIGGPGALKELDNENSYNLIRETVSQNKVLGSICISPVILAKAGVLKNRKATVWSSPLDRSPIKIFKENRVKYVPEEVVVDGKIVTGNGPDAAEEFGIKLVGVLTMK